MDEKNSRELRNEKSAPTSTVLLLFASMLMDQSSDETTWKISAGPLVDVRAYIVHGTVNFNVGRFLDSKCFIFSRLLFLPFYKRRKRGSVVGYKHRWVRLLKKQSLISLCFPFSIYSKQTEVAFSVSSIFVYMYSYKHI